MSMGKSSGSSAPVVTPEQKAAIAAQTAFLTGTVIPNYQNTVGGATDVYNQNAGGVLNAAQNQAGTARQVQDVVGSTGESALRTGISGLESLFNPDYEKVQIQNALAPAQAQYAQNLEMQQRQANAGGMMNSSRGMMADRALAGQTQAAQMQAAGNIQQQIAGQRASAASQLAQLGQGGMGQALGAAGNAVTAAMTPQQLYNQYASVIFGTPASSYTPNFGGTQGTDTTKSELGASFKGIGF